MFTSRISSMLMSEVSQNRSVRKDREMRDCFRFSSHKIRESRDSFRLFSYHIIHQTDNHHHTALLLTMVSFNKVIVVAALGAQATSAWVSSPSSTKTRSITTSLQASRRGFLNQSAAAFATMAVISIPAWADDEVKVYIEEEVIEEDPKMEEPKLTSSN